MNNAVLPDNDNEMTEEQVLYLKQKLINWRDELLTSCDNTINSMQGNQGEADIVDAANMEFDHTVTLRARDRERKLLRKIDQALQKIENGTYGYCEETGEPIGFKRLEARPIASLCIEAQEKHERSERIHKDH